MTNLKEYSKEYNKESTNNMIDYYLKALKRQLKLMNQRLDYKKDWIYKEHMEKADRQAFNQLNKEL